MRLEGIQNGSDEKIETAKFVERLCQLSENQSKTKKGKKQSEKKVDEWGLCEKDKILIKKAVKDCKTCFAVDVKFTNDCGFKSLRANLVLDNLTKKGKVVSTVPHKKSMKQISLSRV